MKYLLTFICVLIMALSNTACAQGTDKPIKILDEALLSQATSMTYSFDNGTVAPDWRYDCRVTVCKDSVRLSVITGYGEAQKYDSIVALQAGQYEQFITRMVNHSITNHTSALRSVGLPEHVHREHLPRHHLLGERLCQCR